MSDPYTSDRYRELKSASEDFGAGVGLMSGAAVGSLFSEFGWLLAACVGAILLVSGHWNRRDIDTGREQ